MADVCLTQMQALRTAKLATEAQRAPLQVLLQSMEQANEAGKAALKPVIAPVQEAYTKVLKEEEAAKAAFDKCQQENAPKDYTLYYAGAGVLVLALLAFGLKRR
jgi:hypothetical protein